jgi:hypothetical protein
MEAGSGSWQPLVLGPDQLLVMVGYSLTVATAGALPTCMHRVVSGTGRHSGLLNMNMLSFRVHELCAAAVYVPIAVSSSSL